MKKNYFILISMVAVLGAVWFAVQETPKQFSDRVPRIEAKVSQVVDLKNGDTFDLTASIVEKNIAGNKVKMLAYNGSIPGPTIRVPKGAEITINFTNNTDTETTLHSHGVRLDNKFDGVPGLTQEAIGVGKTFTYKIKFPDEGVYWYHPHIREDYAQELGLYGTYVVVSDKPDYWSPVNREVPLMVDDILIENGKVAPFGSTADHTLMGRFGNTMLVNGETNYSLSARKGEVVRFLITNVANTRTFNLSFSGAKMKLVGADGGKYERETFVDSVILGPSERAIVEVLFDKSGTYTIEHKTPQKTYIMGSVSVSGDTATSTYKQQFYVLRMNKDTIAVFDQLRQYFDKKVDKSIRLTVDMGGMGSMGGGSHMMSGGSQMGDGMMGGGTGDNSKIEWEDTMVTMNQMATTNMVKWKIVDEDTKKENMDIDWRFKVGDKVKIKIFNDPKSMHPMQHPIHFHGQQFIVLSTNGIKNTNLVWKDTTLVRIGDTVEILLNVTNPGVWMAHCHIAEHLESGMMMKFEATQ